MKKLFPWFLWVVIITSFSYSVYIWNRGPCYAPIEYKIGSFSDKFNISESEFLSAIKQAETIWEKAAGKNGKNLFEYSPQDAISGGISGGIPDAISGAISGGMSINLIYDTRQKTTDLNKVLESKVGDNTNKALEIKSQFESLKIKRDAILSDYNNSLTVYTRDLNSYNSSVDYWNTRGGAPESEYKKLQDEASRLKTMQVKLENERLQMNILVSQINALIVDYNNLVKASNSNIQTINQSADQEFKEGQYIVDQNKREIDIYEFTDKNELVRVLAHELGHALGIDHNANPESIMYYKNSGKKLELSAEDIKSLKTVCRL